MKPPKTPPPWKKLFQELTQNTDSLKRIFARPRNPTHKGKYVHWDKLQYLDPPRGLSREEWWASIKFARLGQQRHLPFHDMHGEPFLFTLPDPALNYLHHIDQDAGGHIQILDKDITNPKMRDRYILRSLMEEAITSSQLEGATSTRKAAKEMIRSNRPPQNRSEQMIMNNYITMQLIHEKIEQPLSKGLIFELHARLTENTLDDPSAAGRFRRADENVKVYESVSSEVVHVPPPASELPNRMKMMCDFANARIPKYFVPPVVRAIILHFWLAYDHPFVDGNGRCARALFYWLMLRQGYWLCEFISISQVIKKAPAKYGRAFLYTESDENDLTYFILYHLRIITRAIGELHSYIRSTAQAIGQTEELLRASSIDLNHRQVALLSHSLRHPGSSYRIKAYQKSNNVVYETARSDLFQLAEIGFLGKTKQGREYVFRSAPDLSRKLRVMKRKA